ncbi:MAG: 50S ribosomal protein L24 [Planctomycetota bacterium]|jgi:large subunit ribosomal protein L24
MARHVRKDDIVEVIRGDHKGQRGKVLRVDPDRGLVVVEGVNMVYRHVRPSRRNPQGGRIQKEAPLHVSNVLPYDTKAGRGSRVRFELDRDEHGKVTGKRRVCVRSGTVLNQVSRPEGNV